MNGWNLCARLLMHGLIALSLSVALAASPETPLQADAARIGQQIDSANDSPTDCVNCDPALHKRSPRYLISPGDTLELTFQLTPELNQTLAVQPDGYIVLRDAGDLLAAGKTLPDVTQLIKNAYSKILHDPLITVAPRDFEKPYFIVGGEVGKPGRYDLRGAITLTQAIALAGGFTDASKHSQVLLFRRASEQWTEARIVNVKQMLRSRDLREDPELRPGDMLFIPKNALSKIKPFLPTASAGIYANPPIF